MYTVAQSGSAAPARAAYDAAHAVESPAPMAPADQLETHGPRQPALLPAVPNGLQPPTEGLPAQRLMQPTAADAARLNALDGYETVFLIDSSAALCAADWARVQSALMHMLPMALAHNAAGGVEVFTSPDEGVRLTTPAQVSDFVFKSMQRAGGESVLEDMVRRCVGDRLGKRETAAFKPLNLVILSPQAPTNSTQQQLLQGARQARGTGVEDPLRVQYSVVDNNPVNQVMMQHFARAFAANNGIAEIVDFATLPGDFTPNALIGQLVGDLTAHEAAPSTRL